MARDPLGPLARHVTDVGSENVCTSIVVASELRFWLSKGASDRLRRRIEDFLERIVVLPFESPADEAYGRIRSYLERNGALIGANDLFIAAHGLALGCTVVTDSTKEFTRVPDLLVENWRR
ncbi:type II toxin-antitoxin system VapC family toxin [Iodidimonas sp. SYSU 1G8]|uniref:type II toxin-antitoxin system VapC family toxin n=1 Tax=Iodidimonas sp. SYSU 1G8 TaxID=3133967 RepID=UPI0031FF1810